MQLLGDALSHSCFLAQYLSLGMSPPDKLVLIQAASARELLFRVKDFLYFVFAYAEQLSTRMSASECTLMRGYIDFRH